MIVVFMTERAIIQVQMIAIGTTTHNPFSMPPQIGTTIDMVRATFNATLILIRMGTMRREIIVALKIAIGTAEIVNSK